jgi:anti-sigma-K factor RskA
MTDLTHDEIESLLGAYALDAVDDDERALIEAHLEGCPRCRAEVSEHRETAALLAYSGTDAPSDLWEGIASQLDTPAPVVALHSSPVTSLRRPTASRPLVMPLAAAAAAVLLVLGLFGWRVMDQGREIDRLAALVQGGDLADLATAALNDPTAKRIALTNDSGERLALVAVTSSGDGYLVPSGLAPLDKGQAYQLWVLGGDAPVSAGVLGRSPRVSAFPVSGPANGFAISIEDDDGAASPTSAPIAAGEIA